MIRSRAFMLAVSLAATGASSVLAQGGRAGGPPAPQGPPPTAQASAPIDLTGFWASIVNEDWRWRMVTPPRGDFPGLPLNQEGQRAANAWDPATDGSCLAYGAGGLMRMPGRPYSEQTTLTEYFDRFPAPNGDEWLVVTTVLNDPRYWNGDFITSTHFRKERDGSKWDPKPFRANPVSTSSR